MLKLDSNEGNSASFKICFAFFQQNDLTPNAFDGLYGVLHNYIAYLL